MKICINNTSLNHHLGSGTPCSQMLVQHPSVTLVHHATETVVHHKPKYAHCFYTITSNQHTYAQIHLKAPERKP